MTKDRQDLVFTALGGIGEIGMNTYLYGLDDRWIMVDLGVSFADDRLPGADLVLPDLGFIEAQKDRLLGLFITHAHEDHLGAVPYLWPRLGCPIYCTRFAAIVLRRKLEENGVSAPAPIHIVEPGAAVDLGPFSCRFVHVSHSIPDANALTIETRHGRLLHTGDWKLDPAPLVGPQTDTDALEAFGAKGVLAMMADSTNVLSPGTSGSEAEVRDSLKALVKAQPNRVVLTTFASNIARLQTAIVAGREAGREIVMVGRSMHRMLDAAKEAGILKDLPPLVDERDAMSLPRHKALFLVTGSQGEPRAALQRIASGQHPRVGLDPGDTAIFSSKIIPGNERTLYDLHNRLVERGVEVITEEDHFVHVSGHPSRDEMASLYRWIRPTYAVPMHGEARHLHAHARFAEEHGAKQAFILRNGDLLRLAPGEPGIVDEVPTGRMAVENEDFVDAGDELFRTRRRLMNNGIVVAALALDNYGSLLASPIVRSFGALDIESFTSLEAKVEGAVEEAIEDMDDKEVLNDGRVEHAVRSAIRQSLSPAPHEAAPDRNPGHAPFRRERRRLGGGATRRRLSLQSRKGGRPAMPPCPDRKPPCSVVSITSPSPSPTSKPRVPPTPKPSAPPSPPSRINRSTACAPSSLDCPTRRSNCWVCSATIRRSRAFFSRTPPAASTIYATRWPISAPLATVSSKRAFASSAMVNPKPARTAGRSSSSTPKTSAAR